MKVRRQTRTTRSEDAVVTFIGTLACLVACMPALLLAAEQRQRAAVDVSQPATRSIFSYNSNQEDTADIPEDYPPTPRRRQTATEERADDRSSPSGTWGISGGLGMGEGYFGAQLTVAYYFNPYIAIDSSVFYRSEQTDDWSKVHYGPGVDLRLSAANPTIFTPFVGAGPGYETWTRTYEGDTYDDGGSLTTNYFVGLNIRLMRQFSLQVAQRTTTYVGDPPIRLEDRRTPEPASFTRIEVQFLLSL